ncbi:hypothetical protein AGLY_011076 [Aphis glycines]|uniref:Uncharacterized protein n=1 Tax=Aphis glycines TaxID=307491 RepID=A0A6G0TDR1_APHGL|nr:hypothetical protein AGLY_011076 [Aphis glycines]
MVELNNQHSVYNSITSRHNASISNLGVVSDGKVNILEVKSKHFPTVFKKIEKNKKKMTEKREFLRKTSFRPNRFFYMVTTEIFDFYANFYLKCRSNFYEICRKRENLQFSISFPSSIYRENSKHHYKKNFNVDKIFLALSKYLKILYKVSHMHNFFLLALEVQILTKIRQNYEYLQIILPLKHKPPFSPTTGNYILG